MAPPKFGPHIGWENAPRPSFPLPTPGPLGGAAGQRRKVTQQPFQLGLEPLLRHQDPVKPLGPARRGQAKRLPQQPLHPVANHRSPDVPARDTQPHPTGFGKPGGGEDQQRPLACRAAKLKYPVEFTRVPQVRRLAERVRMGNSPGHGGRALRCNTEKRTTRRAGSLGGQDRCRAKWPADRQGHWHRPVTTTPGGDSRDRVDRSCGTGRGLRR